MPRLAHGRVPQTKDVAQARAGPRRRQHRDPAGLRGHAAGRPARLRLHVPALQNNANNLLPTSARDRHASSSGWAGPWRTPTTWARPTTRPIPAIYTYFGQFVDHDITLEAQTTRARHLGAPAGGRRDWCRRSLAEIRELKNVRSATLDLDSLYGAPAPADPANAAKMKIGKVSDTGSTDFPLKKPKGKTKDNDLPRRGRSKRQAAATARR